MKNVYSYNNQKHLKILFWMLCYFPELWSLILRLNGCYPAGSENYPQSSVLCNAVLLFFLSFLPKVQHPSHTRSRFQHLSHSVFNDCSISRLLIDVYAFPSGAPPQQSKLIPPLRSLFFLSPPLTLLLTSLSLPQGSTVRGSSFFLCCKGSYCLSGSFLLYHFSSPRLTVFNECD